MRFQRPQQYQEAQLLLGWADRTDYPKASVAKNKNDFPE